MVVPTPEVDDEVLLQMVRHALHASPPGMFIDDSDDDVAGHMFDPVTEIGHPPAYGLADVEACGRAVWAWRGVDRESAALLRQSAKRRRRR